MRQFTFTPIAILAINVGDEQTERDILKSRGFKANKPLVGVYKGQEERAWLVPVTDAESRQEIVALAKDYNQESVLFSGIDRTTVLHYVETHKVEEIGVLSAVPEDYAKAQESYTLDPESGQYFVAK